VRRLERYIGLHVVGGTLIALVLLVALLAFVSFVDDLKAVGRGDYTLLRALEHMVLILPRQIFSILPVAAVVGSLMGLGQLAANSELVVMRAAGVSTWALTAAVLKAAAVLVLLAVIVGEGIAPYAESLAQERRSKALSKNLKMHGGQGVWLRDGNSIVNIRNVLPGSALGGVTIHEFDNLQRLRATTYANRAEFDGEAWMLEGVRQSQIQDDKVIASSVDKARWESVFRPELISVVAVRPESLSVLGLWRYVDYLRGNGLKTDRFELALWTKLAYPLATAVMILLGLPLVLGRFRMSGIGSRILLGALLGVSFHILHQVCGHLGILYGINAAVSAFAPSLVFLGLAMFLMRRLT
jgi:lipopolysaccharide export system permease protein